MWNKHAVWCQCASTATAVLALAAVASTRTFSAGADLYWAMVLATQCVAQFFAAEHSHIVKTPEQWHAFEQKRSYACRWLFVGWSIMHWSVLNGLVITTLACIAAAVPRRWTHKHHRYILPLWSILSFIHGPLHPRTWGRALPWFICERYRRNVRLHNTSTAGAAIRRQYAWRAAGILAESCTYWSFRCTQRFPHTFRWFPVFVAVIIVAIAAAVCHRWIAPTRVSSNSIIQTNCVGHWMAASIVSAQQCAVCTRRLTALDVESSFSE